MSDIADLLAAMVPRQYSHDDGWSTTDEILIKMGLDPNEGTRKRLRARIHQALLTGELEQGKVKRLNTIGQNYVLKPAFRLKP